MAVRTSPQDVSHVGSNRDNGDTMRDKGDSQMAKAQEVQATRRGRGRPTGSKNKPKGLVPKELAAEFLGVVKTILPPEHYEEMRKAVQEGKSISVLSEAKITLKLMSPAIWQRLIMEGQQKAKPPAGIDPDMIDEIGAVDQPSGFSRDLNERMKIYMGLLDFIDKSERRNDEAADTGKKPILEIFARRGVDGDRLRLLVGVESSSLGGDPDESGRQTLGAGTIPDQVPERPVHIPDNAQGSSVGDVSYDQRGDSARSVNAQ
jgi:hypothetical protein